MSDGVSLSQDEQPRPDRRFGMIVTLAIGLVAGAVFLIWPWIDREAAALFMQPDGRYLLKGTDLGRIMRFGFKTVFVFGAGIALIALFTSLFRSKKVFGRDPRKWSYLVACLIIGPGLLANVILKDHWGRARPIHVSHQGKQFTPPLVPSDQCNRNCSFISGESSSIYALFFAAALMGGPWRRRFLGLGLVLGTSAGVMRMAQGGHYLSDVIFSGVFMALVALTLHWLFFARKPAECRETAR